MRSGIFLFTFPEIFSIIKKQGSVCIFSAVNEMKKKSFFIVAKIITALFLTAVFICFLSAADSQKLFDDAKKAYDDGKYSAALELFMDVLTNEPGNVQAKKYLKRAGEKSLQIEKQKMVDERKKILEELKEREKNEKIKNHIEKAQTMLLQKNYDNAEKEYREVLTIDRNNQTARDGMAYISRQRRSPSAPVQEYQPRLPPAEQVKDTELQKRLIENEVIQRLAAANEAFDNLEFIKSESECLEVLKIQPGNGSALDLLVRIRGLRSRVAGIIDEAIKAYNKDQLLRANDKFNQAIDIDPENERARRGITEIQDRIQSRLIKGDFDSLQSRYYAEGFFYYNQKEYPKAIASWERATSLQKSGAAFDLQNREIEEYIKKAKEFASSKKDKETAKKFFNNGMSAYRSGRYASAVKYFRDAVWLDSSLPDAKKMLKAAEDALREEEKRREVKEPVVIQQPSTGATQQESEKYYTQGLMSYASGQLEDAIRLWEMCLRLNPGHTKARKAIEKARYDLNESRK